MASLVQSGWNGWAVRDDLAAMSLVILCGAVNRRFVPVVAKSAAASRLHRMYKRNFLGIQNIRIETQRLLVDQCRGLQERPNNHVDKPAWRPGGTQAVTTAVPGDSTTP